MKKIAIIAFLIAALILAFYLISPAQDRSDTILLADETTMIFTKTEAKISCTNQEVFDEIFKTHGTLFKRFTCTWKTDRYGRYKLYVAYLSKEDAKLIQSWAKTNL